MWANTHIHGDVMKFSTSTAVCNAEAFNS